MASLQLDPDTEEGAHTVEDQISGSCSQEAMPLRPQRLSQDMEGLLVYKDSGEFCFNPPLFAYGIFSGTSVVCLSVPFGGKGFNFFKPIQRQLHRQVLTMTLGLSEAEICAASRSGRPAER